MMQVTEQHKQHLDGWIDGDTHGYCLRVQYEDTDVGGITYHGQYLAFAERARSAYLRLLGIDQSVLLAQESKGFVVRHIAIDYVNAAPYDSLLCIATKLVKMGVASFKLQQIINNNANGHIVARLFVDIVFVRFDENRKTRPERISKAIRNKLDLTT
jgi:acyl-CoA thioester hydrolase